MSVKWNFWFAPSWQGYWIRCAPGGKLALAMSRHLPLRRLMMWYHLLVSIETVRALALRVGMGGRSAKAERPTTTARISMSLFITFSFRVVEETSARQTASHLALRGGTGGSAGFGPSV